MLLAFFVWTLWCVLMVVIGYPFNQPVIRALVRFLAFTIPALFWLWRCDAPESDKLGVTSNAKRGLLVGVAVSFIWLLVHSAYRFQLPCSVHAWLNVILLSPIAEELLFRRVAIAYFLSRGKAFLSVPASAILFALIHLPWWFLNGEKSAADIVILLGVMFAYGVVFGSLYCFTRSIWSSLLPHSVNNLIAESINP